MKKNSARCGLVGLVIFANTGCTQAMDHASNESVGRVAEADDGPGSATGYAFVNANGTIDPNSTSSWGSPPLQAYALYVDTGFYLVRFRNERNSRADQSQGVAQVAAYGGDNTVCQMGGAPYSDSQLREDDVEVAVHCVHPDGTPVDSPFVITYTRRSGFSGIEGGYLSLYYGTTESQVYSESDPPDNIVAKWNSTGQDIVLDRYGAGDYLVTFKGQDYVGGIAQVTGGGGYIDKCEIGGWGVSNGDQVVWVVCTDSYGDYVDTGFSLSVTRGNPILTPSYTYAFADQPTAAGTYIPDPTYQKGVKGGGQCQSTVGTPVSITPRSTGVYDVNFPEMYSFAGQHAAASVTAAGVNGEYCNIGAKGSAQNGAAYVTVRCYDRFGTPTPALFTIAYLLDIGIIC